MLLIKIAAAKTKIKEKITEATLREVFIVKSFMEWAGVPLFRMHTVQQRSGCFRSYYQHGLATKNADFTQSVSRIQIKTHSDVSQERFIYLWVDLKD